MLIRLILINYFYCLGLEIFYKELDEAKAGDQMGALIRSVKREDIKRGQVLIAPGSMDIHSKIEAQVTRYC